MKPGDIVAVPGRDRHWVVLPVTRNMIRRGLNTTTPGMHLFGGAWYGRDLLSHKTYGKIANISLARSLLQSSSCYQPTRGAFKVVGNVRVRRTMKDDLKIPSLAISRIRDRAKS